jgi:hypothetical protein
MRECFLTDDARQRGRDKIAEIQRQQYETRLKTYADNPRKCACCNAAVSYAKRQNNYCSRSCAAKINNLGVRRNGDFAKKPPCVVCEEITKTTYCGHECELKDKKRKRIEEIEGTGCLINYRTDKKYLIDRRGHACEQCRIETWLEQKVPLVLDHIDGNSDNNALSNVRLLCHNCNALTPTFCGKNKGNGRSRRKEYRNKRYSNGESY